MADVVLRRAVDKIDLVHDLHEPDHRQVPERRLHPDDRRERPPGALRRPRLGLQTEVETAKIARIKNTKDVEEFWASEPLLPEILATGKVELLSEPEPILFDASGMLVEQ